jgi:hypothetical protein
MSSNPPWADKKLTKEQRGHMAFRYLDWLLTKNLPSGGFPLLYAILQHFNEVNQFHCFPSIKTLAACIKRKPPTVWEMLLKLEKLGVIEIEWGSQGSGHSNIYRLPAAFFEFYFGPEKGRLPKPDPVPRKHRQAGVSEALENTGTSPKKDRCTDKKLRHAGESHFLATSSHKKERGSAARTSRVDRESATTNSATVDDETLIQRAPEGALIDPVAAQNPKPSRDDPISAAANGADADPAFAAVYRRGRDVLGADADAVTAKLLSAYDGDAESALDTLACAEGMSDPRQYIERDIEAAARRAGAAP